MSIKLEAGIRNVAGKGASRAVRNNKKLPAVIYGEKKTPVAIELDAHAWDMMIRKPGLRTKLFEINTGKGTENAMLVDIQYHPVSDKPLHVDFKRIDVANPVNVVVPIELKNIDSSRGMKLGGTLNFAERNVSIVGKITNIPESIIIDLLEMTLGDIVHGSDLKLPTGIELGLRQDKLAFVAIVGKEVVEVAVAAPVKGAKGAKAPVKAAAPAKVAAKPAPKKK